MLAEAKVGPQILANGAGPVPVRLDRSGAIATVDAHARYQESVLQGGVFSMVLNATNATPTAGNLVGAAAAASTQFALFNPIGSGKNFVIIRFNVGVISGTPGAGPCWHGLINGVTTVAGTGTIRNNNGANAGSQAIGIATIGGTSLTGGGTPFQLAMAGFTSTNTAQASVAEFNTVDSLDGLIVIPQGFGWVPLWSAAGTTFLVGYSVTWEEIPA